MISIFKTPLGQKQRLGVVFLVFALLLFLSHQYLYDTSDERLHNADLSFDNAEKDAGATSLPVPEETHETSTAIASMPPTETPSAAVGKLDAQDFRLPAVIASARSTTNVTWMDELTVGWDLYPYNVDDPYPPPHLTIPANKGHEAMAYLTFIIDNYDSFPPYAFFVHGHRLSWHQEGDIVHLIKNLRIPALESAGYVPLRCDWYPSCPMEIRPVTHDAVVWGPGVNRQPTEDEIARSWSTLFPGMPVPETIASQCCAQFAVTREAVRRHAKGDYRRLRQWVLDSSLPDDVSGRVLEKLWAYIMTGEPVHCPAPQRCACEYFGQCEPKAWPQTPEGLPDVPDE
ncbi:uncharacterized protein K452DRAFT_310922 [Aplosporella prunicola CBS 121167]|uniref:Uncharacterized protein n=1 Tax=Aplosporella prunicola CBS 121167 TaxID=1176127 RepID=A0A6A6B6B4_9PEZI|nr:uncharacterized protein K452DRAFT_310922 [Aplosporella prunicola CBS 121167]KAF2138953.1 hypothetical protein K452DRAFT_310922 [Aplosporella prunicola CBS 121167]